MELRYIPIGELSIAVNMRHGRQAPGVSDILPSVRTRGILQPLLVRPTGEVYEIVAGRRRYFAARPVEQERGEVEPLPCAIMAPGDDADALEASLIENIARLDPDEVSQWETFVRLTRDGRTVLEIVATIGLTELMVKRCTVMPSCGWPSWPIRARRFGCCWPMPWRPLAIGMSGLSPSRRGARPSPRAWRRARRSRLSKRVIQKGRPGRD
jgi:ParB/RepB/Spo0J family partition protein